MVEYRIESKGFLVVGDVHFNDNTPSSRVDDYPNVVIEKFRYCIDLAISRGIKLVITLGDLFHKNTQNLQYLNKIVEVFKYAKDNGIYITGVIGNHDIINENMSQFTKSPLYTLYKSGLLLLPGVVNMVGAGGIETARINYFGYLDLVSNSSDTDIIKVCVAHVFFDQDKFYLEHNLSIKDAKSLGYDLYLLGHDHTYHRGERFLKSGAINNGRADNSLDIDRYFYVLRPGALSRGTSKVLASEQDKPVIYIVDGFDECRVGVERHEVGLALEKDKVFSSFVKMGIKKGYVDINLRSVEEQLSEITVCSVGGISDWVKEYMGSEQYDERVYIELCEALRSKGVYIND